MNLGTFATAEEAALCVARHPSVQRLSVHQGGGSASSGCLFGGETLPLCVAMRASFLSELEWKKTGTVGLFASAAPVPWPVAQRAGERPRLSHALSAQTGLGGVPGFPLSKHPVETANVRARKHRIAGTQGSRDTSHSWLSPS